MAACTAVASLGGQGQVSDWCSREKEVPKSRLWHSHIPSHPVKAIMRKSTCQAGEWQPQLCPDDSQRLLVLFLFS